MSDQSEFWEREKVAVPQAAVERSAKFLREACVEFQPTHIVSLVSGGRDSAAAHEVATLAGAKIDTALHIRTGTGIRQTAEFVQGHYGASGPDFHVADAGTAYERYVDRKGFFGVGRSAHNMAYHILKADPLRAAVSRLIRQRRRGIRVMLLNGARRSESQNRSLNLKPTRLDKGMLWAATIHDWTSGERDRLLEAREVPINPGGDATLPLW